MIILNFDHVLAVIGSQRVTDAQLRFSLFAVIDAQTLCQRQEKRLLFFSLALLPSNRGCCSLLNFLRYNDIFILYPRDCWVGRARNGRIKSDFITPFNFQACFEDDFWGICKESKSELPLILSQT